MKNFEEKIPQPDKTKIVNQRQAEKQKKYLGSTTQYRGHTMYEINCTTGEITEAKFKDEKVVFVNKRDLLTGTAIGTTEKIIKDIETNENCLYISALNKKSAKKKFLKYLIENARPANTKK